MNERNKINDLNKNAQDMTPEQIIRLGFKEFNRRLVFASSLSEEDQVITDMISKVAADIEMAAAQMEAANESLTAALEKLGGPAADPVHHHTHN